MTATVPCNGCRLCCINDMIVLHPEKGDRPEDYLTQRVFNRITGKEALMVQKKPNGECIYLDANGCTIHDNAPIICRTFDCRTLYARFTRAQRKQMVRSGMAEEAVFEAGRKRVHTLDQS